MSHPTEHHQHGDHEPHEHDLGLQHDLDTLRRRRMGRRGLLGIVGGIGAVALVGCSEGSWSSGTSGTSATTGTPGSRDSRGPGAGESTGGSAVEVAEGEIPEETAGPYPGDGSNGPDVLSESGVVRSDLTSSFGSASGVAAGVPLTLRLRVLDLSGDDLSPMAGAAVYAWHCDRDGNYSMYDGPAQSENYLRGVQAADDDGWLSFTTIFPACYSGRWPHVHLEVYGSLEEATSVENKLRTTQLAFPADVCETVYATTGHESSVSTLSQVSLDSDMVFSDGHSLQMARVSGSVADGLLATLNLPI